MSFEIGNYKVDSQTSYDLLTKAQITSNEDLKLLDKNKDGTISEDELVEVQNLVEELTGTTAASATASETNGQTTTSSGTQGTEDLLLRLYEQLDKKDEERRQIFNKMGSSKDAEAYDSYLQDIQNINSEMNQIRSSIYQCYYKMENASASAVSGVSGATSGTAVDTSGGTYTYSGDSAQFVNAFNNSSFNQGVLAGQGAMVASIAEKYGIDPNLLASIMALETGWGTSSAIKNYNNPGGMMDPSSNWMSLTHYSSLAEGIEAVAKNLKNNYINQGLTTISSIGAKYCPVGAANDPNGTNSGWVPSVTKIYNMLTGANISSNTKIA